MAYDKGYGMYDSTSQIAVTMNKVYGWLTLALAASALTAYSVANSPALMQTLFSSRFLFWALIIGEFGLVMWLSARIHKLSFPMAATLFGAYAILNGTTLSLILWAYAASTVYMAFAATAGMFGVMSFVGITTKKDLSSIGGLLIMALFGLIVASVVSIFWSNSTLDTIIIYAGIIIFVGLTAYDTQKVKRALEYGGASAETQSKIALMGALNLYLDFINLFLYLLRFFGRRD